MKKKVYKKSFFSLLRASAMPILFTLVAIGMISYGIYQAGRSSRSEGTRILEEAIKRAAVACYAAEGYYPDSLDYIEDYYNVYIDSKKYVVYYEIFASNIMPDITVIELDK